MPIVLTYVLKKKFPKYVEGKQKYWQFCMFILLMSTTSGDNKTWNISLSTNANQMKLVSTPLFSGLRNLFLLLFVHIFTTGGHYDQLNTILPKILTNTKFLDWKLVTS